MIVLRSKCDKVKSVSKFVHINIEWLNNCTQIVRNSVLLWGHAL
ncbi:hypothetical protein SAMN05216604_101163 [Pseudomonas agarici]|nr:hypothetical protein SAMN05216604_101163 [Pseudomonas agarici]